jgi:hypothetical protein
VTRLLDRSQGGCHRLRANQQLMCPGWLPPYLGGDAESQEQHRKGKPDGTGRGSTEEARRLDLSSAEGRFRLSEIVEVLGRELPAVADLHERLALDLEVDRDTITEAWFVASAFPPATRRPRLPWTTYVTLRFHPARHKLADPAAREGWDQDRLSRELAAWFAARYDPRPESST